MAKGILGDMIHGFLAFASASPEKSKVFGT